MNKIILSEDKIKNCPNIINYIHKYDTIIFMDSYSSKWFKKININESK